jgi:hypothetical protein
MYAQDVGDQVQEARSKRGSNVTRPSKRHDKGEENATLPSMAEQLDTPGRDESVARTLSVQSMMQRNSLSLATHTDIVVGYIITPHRSRVFFQRPT